MNSENNEKTIFNGYFRALQKAIAGGNDREVLKILNRASESVLQECNLDIREYEHLINGDRPDLFNPEGGYDMLESDQIAPVRFLSRFSEGSGTEAGVALGLLEATKKELIEKAEALKEKEFRLAMKKLGCVSAEGTPFSPKWNRIPRKNRRETI